MLVFETAIGACGVSWSEAGITRVLLPRRRGWRGDRAAERPEVPESVREAITGIVGLLDGEPAGLQGIVLDEGPAGERGPERDGGNLDRLDGDGPCRTGERRCRWCGHRG